MAQPVEMHGEQDEVIRTGKVWLSVHFGGGMPPVFVGEENSVREITVWNQSNGDVEKYVREATEEELDQIRDYFEDEPFCEVVIDNEFEVEIEE